MYTAQYSLIGYVFFLNICNNILNLASSKLLLFAFILVTRLGVNARSFLAFRIELYSGQHLFKIFVISLVINQ